MSELLFFASLNLVVIFISLFVEYVLIVKKRNIYDTELSSIINSDIRTKTIVFFPGILKRFLKFFPNKKTILIQSDQSFLNQVNLKNFMLANGAIIFISYNLQNLFGIKWYVTLFISIIIEVVIFNYFKGKQTEIKEAIEKKLPEILDMMARVYRVHNDLRVAIQEIANHSADPIVKKQFTYVAQLSRFGYSVEEALEVLSNDIKSQDLDFVISSIKLNTPVGGNLAYLFEHTASMLRQRKEATDEINNLMFQSKISATISALLVPIIIVVSFVSSPKYQEALLRNPTGRMIFFFSLIWWFIGVVIIRKNSRISI